MLILTTIYSYTYMKKEGQLQFAAVLLPVDLRGVEPLSENPSIAASPITVCYFYEPKVRMFPPSDASRHAAEFSSFILRLYPQSFGYIVSYIVDARVLTCRCARSDSCP